MGGLKLQLEIFLNRLTEGNLDTGNMAGRRDALVYDTASRSFGAALFLSRRKVQQFP